MRNKISLFVFRILRFLIKLFYPETEFIGAGNLPDGPAVIVGNHAKTNAPIACELYFPEKHLTWTAGEMMHLNEVPDYAFSDFWSYKPAYIRWFFRALSYFIAPLAVSLFNNAACIGVYHDTRVIRTFRESVRALRDGTRVVILPEHNVPYNNIVCDFQDRFVDVARLYYKRYKQEISFVPMYTAPALHKVYLGEPVRYDSSAPAEAERERICREMKDRITRMARSLPEHTVVPYPNIPKSEYPSNKAINKEFSSNGLLDTEAWA
jgi:1-acyl-sn-glycerol-3-phosphate acyltransferase